MLQIFHGRKSYRELYEFTEDVFQIVKSYSLFPNEFGTRAAAFYLLHTLYFKQPCRPKVKIYFEYDQYEDLSQWINECRAGRHWEIVYCWAKLITDHAFHFCASVKFLGLEFASKSGDRLSDKPGKSRKNFAPDPLYKQDSFREILESLSKTHGQYENMKKALNLEFSIASKDFPLNLERLSADEKFAMEKGDKGNTLKENGVGIGQRRKNIIEKSLTFGSGTSSLENEDEDEEWKPDEKKSKGKGKGKGQKKTQEEIDLNGDLKTLARSLAAVKEDPSLLIGINESDIVLPGGKGNKRKRKS